MTDALIPAGPLRHCRCGRPVPVGPLTDGWGSGCAGKHGLKPATRPRIRAPGRRTPPVDDGPTLLDLLAEEATDDRS